MKKTMQVMILIVLVLMLAACGSSSAQLAENNLQSVDENIGSVSEQVSEPQGTWEPGSMQFEVPLQTLLILGTFKLEDTDQAIQAEQAKELLPLWQVLKNLLESETVAREEIDALVNQIAETMTAEQMQAIEAMQLTMQELGTLNSELGLDMGFPQAADLDQGEETSGFQRPEGMPEGMPGGGMGPGGGQGLGQGLSPEELESLRATREAEGGGGGFGQRGGGMVNVQLIEALIELLQGK